MRGLARSLGVLTLAAWATACSVLFPFSAGDSGGGSPLGCEGGAPEVVWSSGSDASAVDVAEGYAWVGAWTQGLDIYSLATMPPSECPGWALEGGRVRGVSVRGTEVYTVEVQGSSPSTSHFTNLPVDSACTAEPTRRLGWGGAEAFDLVADQGRLFVAAVGGLDVYDVTLPLPALLPGEPEQDLDATTRAVAITDTNVFVALNRQNQVAAYARAGWDELRVGMGGPATDLVVSGDRLFVTVGDRGLSIRDIQGLEQVASAPVQDGGFANGVAVDGRFVFVCGGTSEDRGPFFLEAFELDEADQPTHLYEVQGDGRSHPCLDIDVDEAHVYLAVDDSLEVISRGCAAP